MYRRYRTEQRHGFEAEPKSEGATNEFWLRDYFRWSELPSRYEQFQANDVSAEGIRNYYQRPNELR